MRSRAKRPGPHCFTATEASVFGDIHSGGVDLGGMSLEPASYIAEGFRKLVIFRFGELSFLVEHGASVQLLRKPCSSLAEILGGEFRFIDQALKLDESVPDGTALEADHIVSVFLMFGRIKNFSLS